MIDAEYKILEIINDNCEITQRGISVYANISLGKTNYIISDLIDRGLVSVNKAGKGASYLLTEKGLELLEQGLKAVSMKRLNLNVMEYKKIKQAVIIAIDKIKEFEKPIGYLEIEDTTIINRIVRILEKNEINDIIIVAGYKNEYYHQLENRNITLVKNNRYKTTGTMESLYLAKDFINDDFILIDSNIIFEERAINEVLNSKLRDCMILSSETGSGTEIFVETQNNSIHKMTRVIQCLNNIDGELVPITKISYNMYLKMLKEYDINENPYFSYKHQLLNISKTYRIGYIKIDDLNWYKITNKSSYKKLQDIIFSKVKKKDHIVEFKKIKNYIINALSVNENDINDIIPIGGMTNNNYKFHINNMTYVIRIPGNGTKEMIDRIQENINDQLAASIGINSNIIYFNEYTGIRISELIQPVETLNISTSKREKNMKLVAELLKKLHTSNINMINEFKFFELINYYEELAIKAGCKFYDDYYMVKDYVFKLKEKLERFNITLSPCHNDPVPENFIKINSAKMQLLDWEYSGLNDPIWDIAAFSLESNFDEDEEDLFLQIYFCDNVEENYKERILIYKICQDFLWSIWTIIKEEMGDDFGTYGFDRFTRCKDNLFNILKSNENFQLNSKMLTNIKEALNEDRFKIYLQPILMSDGTLLHYEVLLRMFDENDIIILPSAFIPVAERHGLMPLIDRWVVDNTIKILEKESNLSNINVFINLSGSSISDISLLSWIHDRISERNVEPSRIAFKIAETVSIKDLNTAKYWISKLRSIGCQFALSGFGVGSSCISSLNYLPIDYLKIDENFIRNLDWDTEKLPIVIAMNKFAHDLGKKTIAGFIENEKVWNILQGVGVDHGQGYYLGKPTPIDALLS